MTKKRFPKYRQQDHSIPNLDRDTFPYQPDCQQEPCDVKLLRGCRLLGETIEISPLPSREDLLGPIHGI
ncbi:hypothetical protein Ciccas_010873 [Cichlidogyrus casuarinus]|uniref:Uncharacterized protein n=1 Tax=Cichlidogyrus casuarinus TaxID=1844966 RepID=A0ABD2PSV5_9PLAT